jgi:tRNA-2-methylthio-N6-dimethylallyladenosine synthase
MKFVLKSFGCQMNKLDSALVASAMKQAGFEQSEAATESDVVIINTCSVRQHAEERVLSHLGHLKHIRKSRPAMVVAVMGCMAQRLGDELLKNESVDIVCGPGQIDKLAGMISEHVGRKFKQLAVAEKIRQKADDAEERSLEEFELANDLTEDRLPNQAFVRAMRGCNKFCTYCVVPYVRGPEASRPPKAIIEQIKQLRDKGVKLVTLLGQTVNSY